MMRRLMYELECRIGAYSDTIFPRTLSTPNGTVTLLCVPSLRNLKKMKLTKPAFKDGATAHTTPKSMALLDEVHADRIFSKTIWPPKSPDLSLPVFFSLGCDEKLSLFEKSPQN